ncbi:MULTISPECIES: MipA/OmpV family protein [Mesorhizobium]|uniref:MipA/OmpV family protein n=5 Tax=Mesorhizobium TaxID=68287 RepID=A0AB38T6P4_9HYPH|nr:MULTISPECIES: MipA/OmpV family protein [Mesorhizobium]MDF3218554.1 MipA/OmpV family protein [Mesorhizobium ciceri]RUY61731.1 MipA/OmpV family protein [Mesorhizobium sp. M7A.F.Ca.CA.001.05.1.1]RUY67878.1 MipA/OmpV family protein [Mesorhizobium sp. M7A.F.Ca.CA.001.13.1.1]RUZ01931.1 MipA/OmpV family protein [Mesorhizobium sp. M7A.F.Ca.CA.001.04.2.1]RUZ19097.1 MipA/OmpV family protein [Mesorhizobium sp. M7A.F.Ca.CA.001.09.1.1]
MFAKIDSGLFAGRASLAVMAILLSAHSDGALAADAIAVNSDDFTLPPEPSRFGRFEQKLSDWHVVLGGGAIIVPKYEGSNEFKIMPVPFVTATFLDTVTIDPTGANIAVYEQGPFAFSARLGYDMGRKEDDSDHLRGLGDVDMGATVGVKAAAKFGPAEIFAQLDKTIGGSDGLEGRVGIEVTRPLSQSLMIGASASAVFADENYMQAYFGVTPEQSARSGLARYDAGAGLKRADFSISATYMLDENWMVRGEAGVGVLLGDAADSPVVVEKIQPSGMLLVGYRF